MVRPVSFRRDDVTLHGRFHQTGETEPSPTVILLHGLPGNEEDVLGLGERLSQRGFNALIFNYSGTHHSDGLNSFDNTQADIGAAFAFLTNPDTAADLGVDRDHVLLGGWSYGGGMALSYAAHNPTVDSVFSIAGTDHGEFMREYASDSAYQQMIDQAFLDMGEEMVRFAPGATAREVIERDLDVAAYDLRLAVPDLAAKRLLLIGGWDDLSVKLERHLIPLYRSLRAEGADRLTVVAFQDGHHFEQVLDELAETVITWLTSALR